MKIILETERLLFRPHVHTDLDDFCAMEMDIDVRRYVGGYPRSREDAERRFPKNGTKEIQDRLSVWATVRKADNKYIGRCGLYPHFGSDNAVIPKEAKLAFYIAPAYWGQGFATESGQAFMQFGFSELGLNRIVASVQDGNDASIHVLQKLGFTLDYVENGSITFCHFLLDKQL
jgi:[ribosomal protein S5]-alanine N-acetyltransferase